MRVKDILLKQKLWFSWNNITSRIIVKGKKKRQQPRYER